MLLKLSAWWDEVEGSLWFIPAAITAAAIGLAYLILHLGYPVIGQQGGQLFATFGGRPRGRADPRHGSPQRERFHRPRGRNAGRGLAGSVRGSPCLWSR